MLSAEDSSFLKSRESLSMSRSMSGNTLNRSRSFTTLFTEDDVLEVPAMVSLNALIKLNFTVDVNSSLCACRMTGLQNADFFCPYHPPHFHTM